MKGVDINQTTGLYVGRFQPFHLGHLNAVKAALKQCDMLVIVIGSAEKSHTLDNPFTAGERYGMIYNTLADENLLEQCHIIPIPDNPSNPCWATQVINYLPSLDIIFSNEPLTRRLFLEMGYEVYDCPMLDRTKYSGTNIRNLILNDNKLKKEDGSWLYTAPWTNNVPEVVAEIIADIDGIGRIKDLAKTDKVNPQA